MTILAVSKYFNAQGQAKVSPEILKVDCNNTLSEVTTAGFLTPAAIQPYTLSTKDLVLVSYDVLTKFFTVAISSAGVITLTAAY